MNPRPPFRSLTFWLGLPGLLFILWSWWDSQEHTAGVFRTVGVMHRSGPVTAGERIAHLNSVLFIERYTPEPRAGLVYSSYPPTLARGPLILTPGTLTPLFPPMRWKSWRNPMIGDEGLVRTCIWIPHWMILLAYCLAWGAVILWRRHRIRRMKPSIAPAGTPS